MCSSDLVAHWPRLASCFAFFAIRLPPPSLAVWGMWFSAACLGGGKGLALVFAPEQRAPLLPTRAAEAEAFCLLAVVRRQAHALKAQYAQAEAFAVRDPWGIRPAFWYMDDELMVVASERPVIQTALNVSFERVNELRPGESILINKAGKMRLVQINRPEERRACSFERIYFSRGSDIDIYRERKKLGEKLVEPMLS